MHKMVVLYPMPDDTAAFRSYYEQTHLPLVAKMPGIRSMKHAYEVGGLGGESPYFAVFEGEFDSFDDLRKALGSPEGKAVGADVPNYATGGAKIIHYEVLET